MHKLAQSVGRKLNVTPCVLGPPHLVPLQVPQRCLLRTPGVAGRLHSTESVLASRACPSQHPLPPRTPLHSCLQRFLSTHPPARSPSVSPRDLQAQVHPSWLRPPSSAGPGLCQAPHPLPLLRSPKPQQFQTAGGAHKPPSRPLCPCAHRCTQLPMPESPTPPPTHTTPRFLC